MLREIILVSEFLDLKLIKLLQGMKFGPDVLHQLCHTVANGAILRGVEASEHMVILVE